MTSPQARITEAVNSAQGRITEAVHRGQESVNSTARTVTDGARTMGDGVQKLVSGIDLRTVVPTLEDMVDRSYAFAVQVLSVQRDFAKSLLAYAAPLPDVATGPEKHTTAAPQAKRTTPPAAKKNINS
ncbi:MAG TPA: hypothetical protein VGS62_04255 [Streptosporangiaceae bacterium]|nr:hypothetical protein [Streptosporangiaceae bacterium]